MTCPTVLRKQLVRHVPTAKKDCWVRVVQMMIEAQTGRFHSVVEIRQAAHNLHGAGSLSDMVQALTELAPDCDLVKTRGGSFTNVRSWLSEGWAVGLLGMYSELLEWDLKHPKEPDIAGSSKFTGGHVVMLCGFQKKGVQTWTNDHDPLCDGRTRGSFTAPVGPVFSRLKPFRDFAGAWAGEGFAFGVAIKVKPFTEEEPDSGVVKEPPVDVEPPDQEDDTDTVTSADPLIATVEVHP